MPYPETITLAIMKFLIFLLFPLQLFCQNITGLWVGSLHNDSTQQNVYYELAISESNGKYTAYSYTTFLVDGKELIGVKSIKIVPQKDHYFFEDGELLFNNYPFSPPKGVKQISSVSFADSNATKTLTGKFITTRTRQYGKQVTGTVYLQEKKETNNDKLITALENLGLINTLSFIAPKTNQNPIAVIKDKSIALDQEKKIAIIDPLKELLKRKIETIETVFFTSDSLILQLYDNGYVDGDSVSLIVNGKMLLTHQRLTTQVITKTILSTTDSLQIIMYAENLGTIAPNTGLLIIYDGEKRHELRFEGDLEKNAAIVLKRKK